MNLHFQLFGSDVQFRFGAQVHFVSGQTRICKSTGFRENRPRIETHSDEISSEMLDFVPTLGPSWRNGNEKSLRFYVETVSILGGTQRYFVWKLFPF